MATISETGHAVNTGNFNELIAAVTAMGATYRPSNKQLMIEALTASKHAADMAIASVHTASVSWKNAVNDRQAGYEQLAALTRSAFALLESYGVDTATLRDARTIKNRILGRRATPLAPVADGEKLRSVSASRQSFDQRLDQFRKLVTLLGTVPEYQPKENGLDLKSLRAFADSTGKLTEAVDIQSGIMKDAQATRDKVLYHERSGLLELAREVKAYIKSIAGTDSKAYRDANAIRFRKVRS